MVHLRKDRFLVSTYNKLKAKRIVPFRIKHKVSDNTYVIDLPPDFQISPTFNVSDFFEYFPLDDAPIQVENYEVCILRWKPKTLIWY